MADAPIADLASLDREVARGAASLARWRANLARDPQANADEDPLEPVRRVAGKATWEALGDLVPSAVDVPLRDALRQWVVALLQARLGRDDEVAWALAASEPTLRYAGEPPALASWRQAWRGVVSARSVGDARLWLQTAEEAGPRLAGIARTRAGKRLEIAGRLGLAHPWEAVVPATRDTLRAAAERLLSATEDLSRATWKPVLRDGAGPAGVLHAAVARDAPEGWPAQLVARWLEETFGVAVRGVRPVLPPLPPALGAASFARAIGTLGFALRVASVARATPFALGFEPGARAEHRLGFALAGLVADPAWQTRALGVGRRAEAQARVLARTMLLDTRIEAARLLLTDDAAPAPADRFEELGERVLGSPLDARLRGAWPASRDDLPARWVARLEALPMVDGLRERFDDDWYRNPKAWAHVRAVSAVASREPVEAGPLDAHVDVLVRAFERALG